MRYKPSKFGCDRSTMKGISRGEKSIFPLYPGVRPRDFREISYLACATHPVSLATTDE